MTAKKEYRYSWLALALCRMVQGPESILRRFWMLRQLADYQNDGLVVLVLYSKKAIRQPAGQPRRLGGPTTGWR